MPLWSSGKIWDDTFRRRFNFNFSAEEKFSPLVWLVYSDFVWKIAYWLLASQISQIPLGQREEMKVHQAQHRFIQHWPDWQTVILLWDKLFSAWAVEQTWCALCTLSESWRTEIQISLVQMSRILAVNNLVECWALRKSIIINLRNSYNFENL